MFPEIPGGSCGIPVNLSLVSSCLIVNNVFILIIRDILYWNSFIQGHSLNNAYKCKCFLTFYISRRFGHLTQRYSETKLLKIIFLVFWQNWFTWLWISQRLFGFSLSLNFSVFQALHGAMINLQTTQNPTLAAISIVNPVTVARMISQRMKCSSVDTWSRLGHTGLLITL